MKVIRSAKIFSKTSANALRQYASVFEESPENGLVLGIDPIEAIPLADVVEILNDTFDLFNSKEGGTGLKAPFTGKFILQSFNPYWKIIWFFKLNCVFLIAASRKIFCA